MLAPWKKRYDQPWQHIKKQRYHFADKGSSSQRYCFSSSHVWMWELHHKEGWALKNWCFWTVVLEKTLGSPLESKEIKSDNLKGNQPWIFTEATDAEAEALIIWPPDAKSWLIGEDPDAGKDWGRYLPASKTQLIFMGEWVLFKSFAQVKSRGRFEY